MKTREINYNGAIFHSYARKNHTNTKYTSWELVRGCDIRSTRGCVLRSLKFFRLFIWNEYAHAEDQSQCRENHNSPSTQLNSTQISSNNHTHWNMWASKIDDIKNTQQTSGWTELETSMCALPPSPYIWSVVTYNFSCFLGLYYVFTFLSHHIFTLALTCSHQALIIFSEFVIHICICFQTITSTCFLSTCVCCCYSRPITANKATN